MAEKKVTGTSAWQGTRLDPWRDVYSTRAQNFKQSEIRSLFSVVSRPEVISLAGGMPNLQDLPLKSLADSLQTLVIKSGSVAMQYGSGQGYLPLREQITDLMRYDGILGADADNVVITTGSQQALDLTSQIFVNPGDVILVESPSYVGALGIFNSYQADVQHLPTDKEGLIPEGLEDAIRDLKKSGKNIKFLYTVPNFNNPSGVTLSEVRRPKIVEICKKHHILIVEDNPYGLLSFYGEPLNSLRSLDPEGVIYLGSFSKIFAPGYRVGWALAPHAIREKLVLASESAILCPSMIGQMSISLYLNDYDWYQQIKQYRNMYQERCNTALQALNKFLPSCTWTTPTGGFYTWITLPEGLDSKEMLPRAINNRVAYVSGTAFYANGKGHSNLRISYCYPPVADIYEGVRRLSQVINKELELVEMFGTNKKQP